jgi:hypothetical protein
MATKSLSFGVPEKILKASFERRVGKVAGATGGAK